MDASTRAEGQNSNAEVRSITNVGVDGRQNLPSGSADVSPFGATFDSAMTDRIVIRDLQPNSTASRLGLQAGDRIIGFNGQTYTDANLFNRDLARLEKNAEVPMIYERNGQRFTQRLRMPTINAQQSDNDGAYGNQGWNGQPDQGFHSANRPVYGASSSSSYSGGMYQGQSYSGNTGMSETDTIPARHALAILCRLYPSTVGIAIIDNVTVDDVTEIDAAKHSEDRVANVVGHSQCLKRDG